MQDIPELIKPHRFAKQARQFSQRLSLNQLPRLQSLSQADTDFVQVSMTFFLFNEKIPCVSGRLEFAITLACQRCLDAVQVRRKPEFKLAFINNEQQSSGLDDTIEPLLLMTQEMPSIDLITDEAMLALPMIAMHERDCGSHQNTKAASERYHPFAALKQTMINQE